MENQNSKEFIVYIHETYNKLLTISTVLVNNTNPIVDNPFFASALYNIAINGMGLLKSYIANLFGSTGIFLNARCIIEQYAFLKMYDRGLISENDIKLFVYQHFLIENTVYKKFLRDNDIDEQSFIEQTNNYKEAKNLFFENLEGNKEEKNRMLISLIPFLRDKDLSYEDIVRMNLSSEYLETYKYFSQLIHSNFLSSEIDSVKVNNGILLTLEILNSVVDNAEKNEFIILEEMFKNNPLLQIHSYETEIIDATLKNVNETNEYKYLNNFIATVNNVYTDMLHDFVLRNILSLKEKVKIVFELFTIFDKAFFELDVENNKDLLIQADLHFKYMESGDEKYIEDAYKVKNHDLDYDTFKLRFKKILGYLVINDDVTSLNKFVKRFLEKYTSDDSFNNIPMFELTKMWYIESQMIGHANGYMYFSDQRNSNDSYQILKFIEKTIYVIFEKISTKINDDKLKNVFTSASVRLKELYDLKHKKKEGKLYD